MLNLCPICKSELKITEFTCSKCQINIKGDFKAGDFSKLSEEDQIFIKVFLKSHGNIKEVEKELGISYPTVKNRLNLINSRLGIETKVGLSREERLEILDKLEQGEITLEQALSLLDAKK
ncbi:MAG: DUF2089 domain-containing protein [candidate division Zixibacteria bacterium]|nr:DUF2089 domain-containing protein [candidate division Zixibacteria bacterium]